MQNYGSEFRARVGAPSTPRRSTPRLLLAAHTTLTDMALSVGDKVSTATRSWGDAWAMSVHKDEGRNAWKTGRTYGTVIGNDGEKYICDFQEDDGQHVAWAREALVFEGRPAGQNRKAIKGHCAKALTQEQLEQAAEQAEQAATAEGLTLVRSSASTGFRYVVPTDRHAGKSRSRTTYQACIQRPSTKADIKLGTFPTAIEAALAVARHLGPEASAAQASVAAARMAPEMSEAEAYQLAEAEGLQLVTRAGSKSGFFLVTKTRDGGAGKHRRSVTSYTASVSRASGKSLGPFKSAVVAALAVARELGPDGCAAAVARVAAEAAQAAAKATAHAEAIAARELAAQEAAARVLTDEQVQQQAAREGLTFLISNRNESGYKGVYKSERARANGTMAISWRASFLCVATGTNFETKFPTPMLGALAYARWKVASDAERISVDVNCVIEFLISETENSSARQAKKAVEAARAEERAAKKAAELAAKAEERATKEAARAASEAARAARAAERKASRREEAAGKAAARADEKVSAVIGKVVTRMIDEVEAAAKREEQVELIQARASSELTRARFLAAREKRRLEVAAADAEANAAKEARFAALGAAQKRVSRTGRSSGSQAALTQAALKRAALKQVTSKRAQDAGPPIASAKRQKHAPGLRHVDEISYRVEKLMAARYAASGDREFRVRWYGYGAGDDTWEPETNIIDRGLIRAFDRQQTSAPDSTHPGSTEDSSSDPSSSQCRAEPEAEQCLQMLVDMPCRTAANGVAEMLTAAAFGPVGAFAFVAPCDCGLGLYARSALRAGQFISE